MSEEKHKLLFVDDEEDILLALNDTFSDDYNVFKTTDAKEALDIIRNEDIAMIISDQRMPEMTGSELLAEVFEIKPETMRVLLTGYADINAAIDAINKGAIHKYVEKPWDDDELTELVSDLVKIYEESVDKLSLLDGVEKIIKRESSFKIILNNIKDGVCAVDKEGSIHFSNSSALNILGYQESDDTVSKKIFDISQADLEEFSEEFLSNKKVKGRIIAATAKDGSPMDVLLIPIFDSGEKQIVGYVFQGI